MDDAATAKLAPFSETVTLSSGKSSTSTSASTSSSDAPSGIEVVVGVAKAAGGKCARCWNYSDQVGSVGVAAGHPDLCERCVPVVQQLGFKLTQAAAAAAEKAQPAVVA